MPTPDLTIGEQAAVLERATRTLDDVARFLRNRVDGAAAANIAANCEAQSDAISAMIPLVRRRA